VYVFCVLICISFWTLKTILLYNDTGYHVNDLVGLYEGVLCLWNSGNFLLRLIRRILSAASG